MMGVPPERLLRQVSFVECTEGTAVDWSEFERVAD